MSHSLLRWRLLPVRRSRIPIHQHLMNKSYGNKGFAACLKTTVTTTAGAGLIPGDAAHNNDAAAAAQFESMVTLKLRLTNGTEIS